MTSTHIRFDSDVDEEYHETDSEDDFTEKEKILLKKARNRHEVQSDSEVEVYGVHSDTSSDIALSDVEGQANDDDLPNVRAWGKNKRHFYSTDYVDPDYGGYQGKDAALADFEEEEAKSLQKQLAQQLDDDDFAFDFFGQKVDAEKKQSEEIITTDISTLSKRQKLQLLEKEAPEFFGLLEDFKIKILLLKDYICPVIRMEKNNKIPECEALKFVQTHYHLILNYCINIYMYLLLKASRLNIQSHPIVGRLYQYRQLFSKIEPIFEEIIKPQIEMLIEKDKEDSQNDAIFNKSKKKVLKILSTLDAHKEDKVRKRKNSDSSASSELHQKIKTKKSENANEILIVDKLASMNNLNKDLEESDDSMEETNDKLSPEDAEDTRRRITYQIAKNKGLTPYRKKELKNPRVKHRNKYRKAKIRRKGAVRAVRTELTRYGGEISGIKTTVSKSIKIKS